jgi:hypothetical protein
MSRNTRLIIVDLVLVLLIAWLGWQLFCLWLFYQDRETAMYLPPVAMASPPFEPLPRVLPVSIQEYAIITKSPLFVADRSPSVLEEPEEPKIMPSFSGKASGVIDLGNGPIVLLSEQSASQTLRLRLGERVGPFKLVAANRDEIVLEWEGEYLRLPVRQ